MRFIVGLVVLILVAGSNHRAAAEQTELRFGLTAVVVRENLLFFDRWAEYLAQRLHRPVRFVQRRAYREIMDLLAAGELELAWICGYPYVQQRDSGLFKLLVVPLYQGAPRYRSYIIVHRDSPYRRLDDLRGRAFAFSDPDSNSGYLVPRSLLSRRGYDPERYFRLTFFTYSHAETVQAVAERVAAGGAVESYVWEFLHQSRPQLVEQTRVIERSAEYGFPPIVVSQTIDASLQERLRSILETMRHDPEGQQLLAEMALDGFAAYPAALYDSIQALHVQATGRPSSPAVAKTP